jgi:hypothetical protein
LVTLSRNQVAKPLMKRCLLGDRQFHYALPKSVFPAPDDFALSEAVA